MKKLIAIDVDGTLLNSKHELTPENLAAIQEAQKQGHVVMICSGRAPDTVKTFLEEIGLDCPYAGSNGAVVCVNQEVIEIINIQKDVVKEIAESLDEEKMPYRLYTSDGIYVPTTWEGRIKEVLNSGDIPEEYYSDEHFERMLEHPKSYMDIKTYEKLEDVLNNKDLTIQKFFVLTLSPTQKEEVRQKLEEIKGIGVTSSALFNLELMHEDGHKGFGVKTMAAHFNIPMENTVAIGDNFNDMPMFEVAGLSVAMGNASEEIKRKCDEVTLSNDDSGVAHMIKTYVL